MAKFVSTVLADTEDVWKQLFSQGGATYKEPRLVLFRGAVAHGLRDRARRPWGRSTARPTRRSTST